MTDEAKERRIQAVKLADALNAIEGGICQDALTVLGKRRFDW